MNSQIESMADNSISLGASHQLVVKPLEWERIRLAEGQRAYSASSASRSYKVVRRQDATWRIVSTAETIDPELSYRSAEEAIVAADTDFRAFVAAFFSHTVEAVLPLGEVVFPEEPDAEMVRTLFTLNTAMPRSTIEIRQVYSQLRNLAAIHAGQDSRVIDPPHIAPDGWQDMASAPLDGTHVILAVREGAFFYAVQGAYSGGEWNVVYRDNVKPLCWMRNIRIPKNFLEQ